MTGDFLAGVLAGGALVAIAFIVVLEVRRVRRARLHGNDPATWPEPPPTHWNQGRF
jgi:hypothetical protein